MKKGMKNLAKKRTYADFLGSLKPIGLGLESCVIRLDRSSYAKMRARKHSELTEVTRSYKVNEVEKGYFNASAEFSLVMRDKNSKSAPLKIDCTFTAHIHGDAPIDELFARRFAGSGLAFLVWPYFREFVNTMTSKMSIARIPIPIVEDD